MAIRKSQVGKLLAAKQAHDNGTGTASDLLAIVRDSTGYEINAAMDESGQSRSAWARIREPRR